MKSVYSKHSNERLNSAKCNKLSSPDIEVLNFSKDDIKHLQLERNEIIYVMKGRVEYILEQTSQGEGTKGTFLFFPIQRRRSMTFLDDTTLVAFRFDRMTMSCENFRMQELQSSQENPFSLDKGSIGRLETSPRLSYFVEGLCDILSDGVTCCRFFEMKVKELFILLRSYCSEKSLYTFVFPAIESETLFSQYVCEHWDQYPSIKALAGSLYMTDKQFYARFKEVFGTTPKQWMMKARAEIIFREITLTNKQFKVIAFENGFSSESQFTRFCKTMFHATPLEIRAGIH